MSIFVNDNGNFHYNLANANYTEEKHYAPTYKTNTTCYTKLQRYELAPGNFRASKLLSHAGCPAFSASPLWEWRRPAWRYRGTRAITIALTGSLIARIDMWNTAAADQLLMIAQTEQSIGGYSTDAALADSGPRTEHSFWTRLRLGHVTGVTAVTRCQHARTASHGSQSTRHTVNSSHAKIWARLLWCDEFTMTTSVLSNFGELTVRWSNKNQGNDGIVRLLSSRSLISPHSKNYTVTLW